MTNSENDQLNNTQLKNDQLKNDQLKNDQLKNDQLKNGQLKNDQLKNYQLKNDQLKNDQLKNEQLSKWPKIYFYDHRYGFKNITGLSLHWYHLRSSEVIRCHWGSIELNSLVNRVSSFLM